MKLANAVLATAIAAGTLVALPAAAFAAPVCDPKVTRSYTNQGLEWYLSDSGTLDNRNSSASTSQSFTYSVSGTLTTTVTAELGVSTKVAVAEVNAKFGVSASVSATISRSQTFTVTAPAHKKIAYRSGIAKRTYRIKKVQVWSNCQSKTSYGYLWAADNYAETHDVR
jgi:hypothetical protein